MLSPLRNRFGIPGVISVIALVFAMFGGAYAASNSSDNGKATASAKAKKGPRGPRGPKGATGPAGPAGPAGAKGDTGVAGANGAKGATGKAGTNGTNGTPGAKGATGATGPAFPVGGSLASGETETGTWGGTNSVSSTSFTIPISFPVALASALDAAHTHFIAPAGTPPADCPGTVSEPNAAQGHLCVYAKAAVKVVTVGGFGLITSPVSGGFGASKYGALVSFLSNEEGGTSSAFGTWAVSG